MWTGALGSHCRRFGNEKTESRRKILDIVIILQHIAFNGVSAHRVIANRTRKRMTDCLVHFGPADFTSQSVKVSSV